MNKDTYGIFYQLPPGVEPSDRDKDYLDERVLVTKRFFDFYKDTSNDVRGFIMHGTTNCGKPTYGVPDIEKCLEEQGNGFDPFFTQVIDPKASSRCGEATRGGRRSAVFRNLACTDRTTPHELCHSGKGDWKPIHRDGTGCAHSHLIDWKGGFRKMGDKTSLMSSGTTLGGLVSPHICLLGWNKPEETKVVTEATAVLIAPVEMAGLHDNEHKHVILKVKGYNDFFLSTRLNYPFVSDDSDPERLYVHELVRGLAQNDPDFDVMNNASVLHFPYLLPGDFKALDNGLHIKYVDFVDGIASVLISPMDTPWPDPLVRNKDLPAFGEAPEAGTYYNPVSSGHGIDVQVSGDVYTIAWFTGNETNDFPRWYTAYGRAGETMILRTTIGGTTWDPTEAKEIEAGEVRLTGNILSFYLYDFDRQGDIIGRRRGGIKMTLLAKNQGGGIFYDKARSGEGINVILYPDFETGEPSATVILWTYGKRKIGIQNTEQRFFTFQGKYRDFEGTYFMNAVAAWGEFMRFGAHIDEAGTGQLQLLDDDRIRFTFLVDGRHESYEMKRLV